MEVISPPVKSEEGCEAEKKTSLEESAGKFAPINRSLN